MWFISRHYHYLELQSGDSKTTERRNGNDLEGSRTCCQRARQYITRQSQRRRPDLHILLSLPMSVNNPHLTATQSAENTQARISVDMTPFQTGPKQTVIQKTR